MPRLTILDDEDDGLTCRLCLASYWYKAEIHQHLKTVHSISDPEKYDKEEKEKKMRRMREEQQRILLAKKQREERERRLREAKLGRGRGGPGTIKLTSPGARPTQTPGQRPSFQYRDGAFICDLCKESFSDGNDMVTHWKSHVKKQQADAAKAGRGRPRGRGSGARGRGRASEDKRRVNSSEEDEDDDGARKKGKGMPRWTAYLLWSTRKRREVVVDHPDWTFAQIAKWISDEWKKIDAGEKDELQKEAEEMNELGIRKLPRDDDGPDPDKDTTDEDSDFEEGYRKKTKPIMLKIKKEKGGEKENHSSDESDWEPEAEIMPPEREQTRSGRQRKRPSFFQEFESQENNLDNILEQFEKEQAQEFGKPRQPKPEKPPTEKKPRKPRKRKEPAIEQAVLEEDVEVEVLRSGRKRKVRRLMTHFIEGSDEDDKLGRGGASSDDDDFEPPPEEEVQKIEENDDQIEEDDEEMASEDLEDEEDEDEDGRFKYNYDMELPPKKRGRPKKLLTDEEIEEATKAAIGTKPAIEILPVPRVPKQNGDSTLLNENGKSVSNAEAKLGENGTMQVQEDGATKEAELPDAKKTARKSAKNSVQENEGFKVKPPWVKETLSDSEGEQEATAEETTEPVSSVANTEVTLMECPPAINCGAPEVAVATATVSDPVTAATTELVEPSTDIATVLSAVPSAAYVNETDIAGQPTDDMQFEAGQLADSLTATSDASGLVTKAVSVNEETSSVGPEGTSCLQNTMVGVPVDVAGAGVVGEPSALTTSETESGTGTSNADSNTTNSNNTAADSSASAKSSCLETAGAEQLELGVSAGSAADPNPPLSEEDLLTGPAHNLDDSQLKPDIVDPNLDDIFK